MVSPGLRGLPRALILVAAAVLPCEPVQASWGVTELDSASRLSSSSAAIDPSGQLVVAYGDGVISFGRYDGSEWSFEVVDASSTCLESPELAVAPDGSVGIVYRDAASDELRFALRTASGWRWERVGTTLGRPVLAFDPSGRAHIAFEGPGLRHAVRNAGGWVIDSAPGASAAADLALAVDAAGQPAITYYDAGAGRDHHLARPGASGWTDEIVSAVGTSVGRAWGSRLAFDSGAEPAVACLGGSGELIVARRAGATWTREVIDPSPGGVSRLSLVFDAGGRPNVSYSAGGESGDVTLARRGASGWSTEIVATRRSRASLALDAAGRAHLTFTENGTARLEWAAELEGSGFAGGTVLAATGADGQLAADGRFIDAVVANQGLLSWHRWDASEWRRAAIGAGTRPVIAQRPDGNPSVAYYEPVTRELRYATWNGATWVESVVGPGSNLTAMLAIDASGDPALAYQYGFPVKIMLARRTGGGPWSIEPVDPAATEAQSAESIAFDSAGTVCVAYREGATGLRYARRLSEGVWDRELVDPAAVPGSTSLVFDAAGNPRIAYRELTGRDLGHALREGGVWRTELVDAAGEVGFGAKLVLESSGLGVIAYWDSTNGIPKLAREQLAGGWSLEQIDVPATSLGALALGPAEAPVVLLSRQGCGGRGGSTLAVAFGCGASAPVESPLRLTKEDAARHVRLAWGGLGASRYDVWFVREKAELPLAAGGVGPAELLAGSPTLLATAVHEDAVAASAGASFFYAFEGHCDSGACCAAGSGLCREVALASRCVGGDSYEGDGSRCAERPCSEPIGACCDASAPASPFCTNSATQAGCEAGGFRWGGAGSTCCDANPCSVFPTGACCDIRTSPGTCIADRVAYLPCSTCLAGAYAGDGTTCLDCP